MTPGRKSRRGKGVVRGRSTAFIITVAVHVVLLLVAGSYVALTVLQREEPRFEGKQLARPKMELKKLQVPIKVKKIRQPKFKQTMAAPVKSAAMDFKMPAMGGIKGGMDSLSGGGLGSLGFGMRFDTLFGGDAATGNELVGTFYDLKQTAEGMPCRMDKWALFNVIKDFFDKSWREKVLEKFYQAPQKKHAICLVMPHMRDTEAPKAFGVADTVKAGLWIVHYKGEITAPERGRYRFCGEADNIMVVRVGRKIVLDASFPSTRGRVTDWESEAPENWRFPLSNQTTTYGDWFQLRKGQSVPVEILISELGGVFSCHLLIEQEGATYAKVTYPPGKNDTSTYEGGESSVLPVFKMAEIPEGLKEKMKRGLKSHDKITFEGPVFGKGL